MASATESRAHLGLGKEIEEPIGPSWRIIPLRFFSLYIGHGAAVVVVVAMLLLLWVPAIVLMALSHWTLPLPVDPPTGLLGIPSSVAHPMAMLLLLLNVVMGLLSYGMADGAEQAQEILRRRRLPHRAGAAHPLGWEMSVLVALRTVAVYVRTVTLTMWPLLFWGLVSGDTLLAAAALAVQACIALLGVAPVALLVWRVSRKRGR